MLAVRPELSPDAIQRILMRSARAIPTSEFHPGHAGVPCPSSQADQYECYCTTSTCGAGMLDAAAAVWQASNDGVAVIGVSPRTALGWGVDVAQRQRLFPSPQATRLVRYRMAIGRWRWGDRCAAVRRFERILAVLASRTCWAVRGAFDHHRRPECVFHYLCRPSRSKPLMVPDPAVAVGAAAWTDWRCGWVPAGPSGCGGGEPCRFDLAQMRAISQGEPPGFVLNA